MIEPESEKLTIEILESLEIENVIYVEIAEWGAMGNRGGVLIYYKEENSNIIRCLETNHYKDAVCYSQAEDTFIIYYHSYRRGINNESNPFNYFYGGMGNHVFINKNANIQISEDFFINKIDNIEYKIFPSARGVFNNVVAEMKSKI